MVITIRDQGSGAAPEEINKTVAPFFPKKVKGTGLGLAITKGLILRHGGTITVATDAEGGARFAIRLPGNGSHQESAP